MINRKMKKDPNLETYLKNYGSLAPKRYQCSDIKKITNSFREKLGEGGFCSVYKGKLEDGRLVAVKVLKVDISKGNGNEFINEVISISRTSHVNIVSLLGYCYTRKKKALLFEFMPNGSLEKFIHDENISTAGHLPWEKLHEIAVGIARGLEYLHRGCSTRILHFDIKPHNILLDEDFCPKISDFGLAKLCQKESISMLDARGTVGYIAPEVFSRNFGRVSHKSDVYGFGMMVLEMVGGRRNVDIDADHSSEIYYPHWVYDRLQQENSLGLHGLMTSQDNEIAKKMIIIGLWCIQTYPVQRPSMNEVLFMLEASVDALKIPPKPFLYTPSRTPIDLYTAPIA
ncbi:LEAF RUST 10 DISEASE-RESISTANCE LOCUS RECEPTOR-LIKE PROTEIN KINASE-like 2.5 [Durio zibethinus]|uniref:LEAF RUST 10 DISEASE-RESISTANCE LOCUS RECEPTOR-LIKE PROTEIN KINASE-like 2.5 n=1 Tax=Durio zibethinus TaxID=66656 RepID=A0A6P5YA44_DURZI|nr:LEAF RUST 10 DISEASE-RESISTANCE LOCUS RECEPTOR-LIKE PROTEIN KINASE-like 2.5 [Durio zibethinus]